MANRLKQVLKDIIHEDQVGFLPNRQMKDNMRIILDVIEYLEKHNEVQAAIVFLDAEKAFDNVNWNFIFQLLEKMNFGDAFSKGIKAIYTKQQARLVINGDLTNKFEIQKGTRQGCPLSPLLFILTLEVLNRAIRRNVDIKGLKVKKEEYKLRAFADDLAIILTDPNISIEELRKEIQKYGKVAGLKVNETKTKVLVKNMTKDQQELFKIKSKFVIEKKVKYLGIFLTNQNIALYKNNYLKTWAEIKQDLLKWSNLQLSLLGRISLIKMNILPRMMFLFQVLPIINNAKDFKNWQKDLSKFLWQGKKPRIRFKLMQDSKERGGLGVPNFKLYYAASCIGWIAKWFWLKDQRLLQLEGEDLRFGWHGYLWYNKARANVDFRKHFIRNALYKTWMNYKNKLYLKMPLWVSPQEALLKEFGERKMWLRYEDLLYKKDDVNEYDIKTREQLNLEGKNVQWFTYLQLVDIFRTDKENTNFEWEKQEWENNLRKAERGTISMMYKVLLQIEMEHDQVKDCMTLWARNFGYNIQMDQWVKLWVKDIKFTACVTLKENIYKMMYRWYLTPYKLGKMYHMSTKCWKCKKVDGTFYHMWWTCEKAKKYWKMIGRWMRQILNINFEFKPELFLLGIVDDSLFGVKTLILYMVTAARLLYAQKWKQEELPTEDEWIIKLMDMAEMDKLTNLLKDKTMNKFIEDWGLFIQFLRGMGIPMEGIGL